MRKVPVLWQKTARILVAIGLLAAACTTQSGAPASQPQAQAVLEDLLQQKLALQCEAGQEWWRASGPPKRGGIMVEPLGATGAQALYDHNRATSGPAQVYSHFVKNRACYYEDTVMESDVVKSWQVSADGRTWTLKLRDDLKWHNLPPLNGRPVTSADLAWTIDLMVKEGATRTLWNKLTHHEPDPYTIVLTLKAPDPDFLVSTLGDRNSIIIPREIYEQYGDYKGVAVGSGPFMLSKWEPNISIERVRNPDWPDKGADGQSLPYLDGIKGVVLTDTSAEIAAARAGQIDRTGVQSFFKHEADAFRQDFPKFRSHTSITACPWGGFINPTRKPFDDIRVRKGLALALDQEEMIQGALAGGAVPTGYLPVAITQYAWSIAKVKEKFKSDPEEAKRLLAEAGYGPNNPLKFKLFAGQVGGDSGRVEVAQEQWKRIGVETEIQLLPQNSSTYLNQLDVANGKYDSMWGVRSPCTFDTTRWMGTAYLTGSSLNVIGISDPKLDALATAQMSEIDPVKRKQILDQMQDYVYELRPYFVTDSRMYFRFDHCRLKNMRGLDQQQFHRGLVEAWIDSTGC